ncbi:hypothetical protein ACFTXO_32970 [Streptomyces sp. NPDC057067]|uniref:hypothetical protein n=1 Tax=unclassified Streptomyces TaxID=2593676 RepID=UPI003629B354
MTHPTGHTTEPLSGAEPRRTEPREAAERLPGDSGIRETRSGGPGDLSVPPAPRTAAPAPPPAGRNGPHEADGTGGPLVPRGAQDALSLRMQQAVTDFVESPRRAVEEADSTFDEIVSGLTEALAERRRVLRASWQEQDTEAQTEELRIALQRYRDLSEQLLRI